MIPTETIEQIAAANDIVEVIGSYFPLKRAGANFKALCPFHQEKTPSFHGQPATANISLFRLWRWRQRFSVRDGVRACRFSGSRAQARDARVGITDRGRTRRGDEDRQHEARRKLLRLHAEAAEWFHENLVKSEIGEAGARIFETARHHRRNRRSVGGLAMPRRDGTRSEIGHAGRAIRARELAAERAGQNDGRRTDIRSGRRTFMTVFAPGSCFRL